MIIAFDYPGPFFAKEVKITSSDDKSLGIDTHPEAFAEFKPRGKAPWSITIGSSTVVKAVDQPDALVVYQGQKSSVLRPS